MRFSLGTNECPRSYYNTEHAVAGDYIRLFAEVNRLLSERGNVVLRKHVHNKQATLYSLDIDKCSAKECAQFYENVTNLLAEDKAALAREANTAGKTLQHAYSSFAGSIPIPANKRH
jgi:hypothetical protein